jgi:class 3 adenylate cyclase
MADAPETRIAHSADGTSLSYQVFGMGPRDLVILGGGPFGLELMWDDPGFVRVARRLSGFSRTIWLDPRAWGGSEGDPLDTFDGETSDADLLAVLDAEAADKPALVGWSLTGGRIVHLAATHPQRVSALILIDSCAHYLRDEGYPWGFRREALDQMVAMMTDSWATASDLEITAPSRSTDDRFRAWYARARRASAGPTYLAKGFRASLELDVRPLLTSVSVPTLVLHREGDRFINPGAGRYLAEHIQGAQFVLLPGDDHHYFVGDTDSLVDEIEDFLTGNRSGAVGEVVLAAVLFTDIVSSTEIQARVGPREWSRLTDRHDALVREALGRHGGREVKTTGDGFLATFDATAKALHCGDEILAQARNIGLDLRAGVHAGDVEMRGGDIAGLTVNIAKRVCDLAPSGSLLVTDGVRQQVVGSGIGFTDRGDHHLKGVPGAWRLFALGA